MKLYYYKDKSNVGDALNPFIFNYLLPEYFKQENKYSNINFYGIGTLIFDYAIDKQERNIFFGTGLRDVMFEDEIKPEHRLEFRFVRGPLSAKLLGGKAYITDPAYLVKTHPYYLEISNNINVNKEKYIGIIPYYLHEYFFTDFNLPGYKVIVINPSKSPEEFLKLLSKCSYVITGAMHGAILADSLRIPWCRLKLYPNYAESSFLSDFKWHDWSLSVDIRDIPTIDVGYYISTDKSIKAKLKNTFIKRILSEIIIKKIQSQYFTLSAENILSAKLDQLMSAVQVFKKDYPI